MASAHQKEAVVRLGGERGAWRLVSDEGVHLGGTDLAPFPLGFFNAGLHADLAGRLVSLAKARGIGLAGLGIRLKNFYSMTGSFFRGDGQGFAEPVEIEVALDSEADGATLSELVGDAVDASPGLALMRAPVETGFALYVNGRRRPLTTMPASGAADAPDPFATYAEPPAPEGEGAGAADPIRKTGEREAGTVKPAPAGTSTRIVRIVDGSCRLVQPDGLTETETWLALPGASHFSLRSDERADRDEAPQGLALLWAGLAFCFMTQLDRYIEHMKFAIDGVRLVQYCPDAAEIAAGRPVDTHLFLNGREELETYETLMRIAARTCYLHATLAASLEPRVSVLHRETAIR
ncbi:MAG: hypothetical protein OXI22_00105 [Defluviicoccus sp.]|nr:hypothetical protein [Defluviicoccus sp.]MDE0382259.1 hypothetical protein [Defluviicoccus sp.]